MSRLIESKYYKVPNNATSGQTHTHAPTAQVSSSISSTATGAGAGNTHLQQQPQQPNYQEQPLEDAKYGTTEMKQLLNMVSALTTIANNGCTFVVGGRVKQISGPHTSEGIQ